MLNAQSTELLGDVIKLGRERDNLRHRVEAALRVIDALPPSDALTAVRAVLTEGKS